MLSSEQLQNQFRFPGSWFLIRSCCLGLIPDGRKMKTNY
jgi:hypothetical protein